MRKLERGSAGARGIGGVAAIGYTPRAMSESSLYYLLRGRFASVVAELVGEPVDPVLKVSSDPKFGDYQCNVAMQLAKKLGKKPRDIASSIVDQIDLSDIADPLEIAGPGFINVRLSGLYLAQRLGAIEAPPEELAKDRLNLPRVDAPRPIVVDYSSPNIAKQMHVGHLRSTVIGDVFVRILDFWGHHVLRQNHVGDWGTQFGMLIRWYRAHELPGADTPDALAAIENDYRAAQQQFKTDPAFAEAARNAVGQLQGGDPEARQVWNALCDLSRQQFTDVYHRLDVLLTDDDVRGESSYNELLADMVSLLKERLSGDKCARAQLREDDGALCIFLYDEAGKAQYANPDGDPVPMIVQKSDGAFLYATTDLAALNYRTEQLKAQRIIYVTDGRQQQHFKMLFDAGRAAGIAPPETVELDHVWFGSVLGDDRKPLKTRSGDNVKLRELLDEAERRALEVLQARTVDTEDPRTLDAEAQRLVAQRIGIGAVKYFDLARDRTGDYVFDWDQMLAFTGNTAPYMMYAYARIRSIYRKAAEHHPDLDPYASTSQLRLDEPVERLLALQLARLHEVLETVAQDLYPHVLCTYLFELAQEFMRFYEACSVLDAPDAATRASRMRLCDLTARTLHRGLTLLGITPVERM